MKRYLFVIDDAGRELPGTRRNLDECKTPADAWQVERGLLDIIGEGCHIRERRADGTISL